MSKDNRMEYAEVPAVRIAITDTCRRNRGDMPAFIEAAKRAQTEYIKLAKVWPLDMGAEFQLHLIVRYPRGQKAKPSA